MQIGGEAESRRQAAGRIAIGRSASLKRRPSISLLARNTVALRMEARLRVRISAGAENANGNSPNPQLPISRCRPPDDTIAYAVLLDETPSLLPIASPLQRARQSTGPGVMAAAQRARLAAALATSKPHSAAGVSSAINARRANLRLPEVTSQSMIWKAEGARREAFSGGKSSVRKGSVSSPHHEIMNCGSSEVVGDEAAPGDRPALDCPA